MAYKRSYNRRSKRPTSNRRLSYMRGAKNAYALAKQAAKDVWYLKGLVNSEMLHTQTLASANVTNTGTMLLLNGMAQNDTSSGRTGNSVLMRNVHLRLAFTQANAASSTIYRVILLWDTQQVGDTNPTTSDLLEATSPFSPLATASAGRFKIIKSWYFSTDDARDNTKLITYYGDFRVHTRYNGTANTDIQKNGLYLFYIADQATNVPTITYSAKVGYHDN